MSRVIPQASDSMTNRFLVDPFGKPKLVTYTPNKGKVRKPIILLADSDNELHDQYQITEEAVAEKSRGSIVYHDVERSRGSVILQDCRASSLLTPIGSLQETKKD